jgi:hypothetical protein
MGKKKAAKKPKEKGGKEKQPPAQENTQENTFDFGGIPDRNLKKNLGCG